MKKKYKKIVIVLVFLTLAIALVYGADIDKIKIEKIKLEDGTTQYYIYRLTEVTTDKKIDEDRIKFDEEIAYLENEKNYLDDYYGACMYMCPETYEDLIKELKVEAKEFCEADCDTERTDTLFYLEETIKFKEAQKIKLDKIK